jgi:hypothetical protein
MGDINQRIQAASARHTALLTALSEMSYGASSLVQHQTHLKALQDEKSAAENRIEFLTKGLRALKIRQDNLENTPSRKFAKLFGSKFGNEKGTELQRNWADAVQKLEQAHEAKALVDGLVASARDVESEYKALIVRHKRTQEELDDLYSGIFDGPTPGFPEEDNAEGAAANATRRWDAANKKAESCRLAVISLQQAKQAMQRSLNQITLAGSASGNDPFDNDKKSEYYQRNALSQAETAMTDAQSHISDAQRVFPDGPIGAGAHGTMLIEFDMSGILQDVVQDHIFTGMGVHKKITKMQVEIRNKEKLLDGYIKDAVALHKELLGEVAVQAGSLKRAKDELQGIRMRCFGATPASPPPEYTQKPRGTNPFEMEAEDTGSTLNELSGSGGRATELPLHEVSELWTPPVGKLPDTLHT